MIRRTFCEITSLALVGSFSPLIGCSSPDRSLQRKLSVPLTLATVNSSEEIVEIGIHYLKQFPKENDPQELMDLLLKDTSPKTDPLDSLELQELMLQKVQKDFETGETLLVKGWVVSKTEARQCALYSLTQSTL